jgi:NhaA family Na+:H+ antiporter
MFQSGVHATIAGVLLGLLTPVRPVGDSVAEHLEHQLHPVSSFVIIPIFALANAGVEIRSDALDGAGAGRLVAGVAVGLVAGKLLGIVGATWLAVRTGLGRLPDDADWSKVAGIAAVAGIGFTVSLFVAGLAYDDPSLEAAAKIGILGGSLVAALIGTGLLLLAGPKSP